MENQDLKNIKKLYGEKFMHLCRSFFPTILETEGLLTKILSEHFAYTHSLYDDITINGLEYEFKNYIYSFVDVEKENPEERLIGSPEELMKKAGYILYPECKTEKEIQSFKHYYRSDEELCTFKGERLKTCRVWFAVKENVDEILREDFKHPIRQDEYGTSVISIQFSKGKSSTLSIKNRYNHTVKNPDSTFSNNLNNIINGLQESFCETYNINLVNKNEGPFEMPDYVMANDGKFYRKSVEINGVNYCGNNIIIKNDGEVEQLDKFSTILFENYVLDLKSKSVKVLSNEDNFEKDSFTKSIGEIQNIKIENTEYGKNIIITPTEGKDVAIILNKNNEIIGYYNENVTKIGNDFLLYNRQLQNISLPNVTEIGDNFLPSNEKLLEIKLSKVEKIGHAFLSSNEKLDKVDLSNVKYIGEQFLWDNLQLKILNLPKVEEVGEDCLSSNEQISIINMPKIEEIGDYFLSGDENLEYANIPLEVFKKFDNYKMFKKAYKNFNRHVKNADNFEEFSF